MKTTSIDLNKIINKLPIGTKLYCTAFGEVTLSEVDNINGTIFVERDQITDTDTLIAEKWKFDMFGKLKHTIGAECILFPNTYSNDWQELISYYNLKLNDLVMIYYPIQINSKIIMSWILGIYIGNNKAQIGETKIDVNFENCIKVENFIETRINKQ